MIQREQMMGKESLRRAVRDVAHDWYRLSGCFIFWGGSTPDSGVH